MRAELTIGESVFHEAGLSELAKKLLQNTSLQILNIDEYTTIAEIETKENWNKPTQNILALISIFLWDVKFCMKLYILNIESCVTLSQSGYSVTI